MSALIYCPFPSREEAREAANILLSEKLIGCANILGETESIFEWDKKVETAQEFGILFKTSDQQLKRCVERLGDLHRYTSPAILGWVCDESHPATDIWLNSLGT